MPSHIHDYETVRAGVVPHAGECAVPQECGVSAPQPPRQLLHHGEKRTGIRPGWAVGGQMTSPSL